MDNRKTAGILAGVIVAIGAIIAIFAIIASLGKSNSNENPFTSGSTMTLEEAANIVNVSKNYAPKGSVSYDTGVGLSELPDIDKQFPVTLEPEGKTIVVEIFSSPEKAGTGTDGWMVEMAKNFNSSDKTVNGKSVGIRLRSISSGAQIDYITTNTYMPDAISPSAMMWADMLKSQGINIQTITDKTVGNVAGVLVDQNTYKTLEDKYKTVDIKAIVEATCDGTLTTGYTNPFASTTGLNFLASVLTTFDNNDPLSTTAIDGFNKFQNNVPFVAYNTLQMRTAAENGTFNAMMTEYQTYSQDMTLKSSYKFIPFGVRHDNPLVAVGKPSDDKIEVLNMFAEYLKSDEATKLANSYGFNQMNDYNGKLDNINENSWAQIQKLWKKNKNTSKPIAAVFVLDTSGSMAGEPLNSLKASLSNSMKYINSSNYVGVVSYSTGVNVDLEIGQFDINQQAYFMGAVDSLTANGNTATYSAVCQAEIMLNDFMKDNPNVSPMIFLLSDGQANSGASLDSVKDKIAETNIPIYTIGYNADLDELKTISEINEAATINADTDDVIYQLKNLFNANL